MFEIRVHSILNISIIFFNPNLGGAEHY